MGQALQATEDPMIQWVTFRLSGEIYGVDVMRVQEVLRYTDIAPVPGASDHVLGIINLRGTVVTVLNTRTHFGLPPGEITDLTRIVIVEVQGHVISILVDSVAEVVYLRQSEIESTPNVGSNDASKFIQGVCHKDNRLLILIDLNKLLSEEDLAELTGIES